MRSAECLTMIQYYFVKCLISISTAIWSYNTQYPLSDAQTLRTFCEDIYTNELQLT